MLVPLLDTPKALSQLGHLLPQCIFGCCMPHVYNKLQKADAHASDELILLVCLMTERKISIHLHKAISGMPRGSPLPK